MNGFINVLKPPGMTSAAVVGFVKRYSGQRAKSFISRLIVQHQQPGTHDAWAAHCVAQGASAAQIKPVHSLDNEQKREFFLRRLSNSTEEVTV